VKCSTLYNGDGLQLTTFVCYSWEMALNVDLDVSFNSVQDWKGILEKRGEVNSMKAYSLYQIMRLRFELPQGVTLVSFTFDLLSRL
jgi:hypothetical protein